MVQQESASHIVVMGATGSGKSTFINLVSGSDLSVSDSLKSCTSEVRESQPFTLDDQTLTLVDTPGFNDTTRPETDIVASISASFANMHKRSAKLAGVMYMHRISDVRMGGTSLLNFRIFCELCGNESLANALIVTTMWSNVDRELGETRERELATAEDLFKPALDNGAQLVRHDGTLGCAQDILRLLIAKNGTTLRIQYELVEEGKEFIDTAVGAELAHSLTVQAGRLKARYGKLRKKTEDALRVQDQEEWAALQPELDEVQREQRRVEDETKRLQMTTLSVIDKDVVWASTGLFERLREYSNSRIGHQPISTLPERFNELQKARKDSDSEWVQNEAHRVSEVLHQLKSRGVEMYNNLQAASRSREVDRQDRAPELAERVDQTLAEMQGMQRQIDGAIENQTRLMAEVRRQHEGPSGRNFCDRVLAWFLNLP